MNAEYVRSRLQYDPETGKLRWKLRDVNRSDDKRWNNIWAGTIAGSVNRQGYRIIGLDGGFYQAGRLIWFMIYGKWPKGKIMHINGNLDDNRLENLLDVPHKVVMRRRKDNTGLPEGVFHHNNSVGFIASIAHGSKQKYLGQFESVETAVWVIAEAKRIVAQGGGVEDLTKLRKAMTERLQCR
jgi:hypothetical protein